MLRKPDPIRAKMKPPSADSDSDSSNARFFKDIEALSKALALDPKKTRRLSLPPDPKSQPEPESKSKSKPGSAWSWKSTLKSLSHIRHRRFDCTFTLHVSSIDGLPPALSASTFLVHWRRTSDPSGARTRPAKAIRGSAQFDETLACRCSIYATRSGPHKSAAKYEPRNFLVYVTLVGSTGFDFGKHRVELTRILPATMDEIEGEKREGEWSTSFKMTGKARGAVLNVSFGFEFLTGNEDGLRRLGSFREAGFSGLEKPRVVAKSVDDERRVLREVNKQELERVDFEPECEVFVEKGDAGEEDEENEGDEPEFTVVEQGIEIEVQKINEEDEVVVLEKNEGSLLLRDSVSEDLSMEFKEFEEVRRNGNKGGMLMKSKSLSLDDASESIANEFLSMLGLESSSETDPESPREKLWKEFEKESLIANDVIFGQEIEAEEMVQDFDLSSILHSHQNESLSMNWKSRAQMLEDEETERLMREMGLNEKVFESSTPTEINGGFGSPIHVPTEEEPPLELPPLGENLGPFLQTKDGGFLRSMSPTLFAGSKNNGSLVMQASSPVVVPAEMGSDVMEILQGLASVGIEKLSMQASKLMPLEDITGKTMLEVAWDAKPSLESYESQDMFQQHLNLEGESVANRTRKDKRSRLESSRNGQSSSEYVSLEDLAPLAMDKIEALSIEGLKVQSDMSNEEAPSNITSQFIGKTSALNGEGAIGLKLLDVKDNGDDVDGLIGLSISLDEWMRLDSGVVDNEEDGNGISERTTKVLSAHHAKSTKFLMADRRGGKSSGRSRRWGLMGNNFTVALMVQLRDPLRDYEPVGTPMLALIQVERVFVPPKPRIYTTVSEAGSNYQDDDNDETDIKLKVDTIPQFKITEVHVAGLKTEVNEASRKKLWGNQVEKQSGSRWLLANGMGKSNKHSLMNSNSVKKPVQPADTLWSVSSQVHGNGARWKGLAALNPFRRNPNVSFSE